MARWFLLLLAACAAAPPKVEEPVLPPQTLHFTASVLMKQDGTKVTLSVEHAGTQAELMAKVKGELARVCPAGAELIHEEGGRADYVCDGAAPRASGTTTTTTTTTAPTRPPLEQATAYVDGEMGKEGYRRESLAEPTENRSWVESMLEHGNYVFVVLVEATGTVHVWLENSQAVKVADFAVLGVNGLGVQGFGYALDDVSSSMSFDRWRIVAQGAFAQGHWRILRYTR